MKTTDHDILIEIRTDLRYIKKKLDCHSLDIKALTVENQVRKDWQENTDTKTKMYVGIATFVGGAIVFLVDRVLTFISR